VAANESVVTSAPEEFLSLAEEHPATYGVFTPEGLKALLEEYGLEIIEMSEVKRSGTPSMTGELGVLGTITFMVKNYWKILWKLVSDPRYRRAARVDDGLSKYISEHGGFSGWREILGAIEDAEPPGR